MLATTSPISYRQLPLRLYQIGPKFRDELKDKIRFDASQGIPDEGHVLL